jgi:hypothetical protein
MLKRDLLDDEHCQGVTFAISDVDALARAIALVLVQEFALARSILSGDGTADDDDEVALDADEINDIVARRLKPADVYHRDGFLFQLIMWLAAHLDLEDGDVVALPHAQASAKGQDSIVVHRADGAVVALSICEDKATENPRDTVRDEVWPEIRDYEAGGRRDELRSNIIATLGLGGVPADEAGVLVRKISWEGKRRYRVRLTLEGARSRKLFKGFDEIVAGGVDRRRGETVHLPKLRDWMTEFAAKVEAELRRYAREE